MLESSSKTATPSAKVVVATTVALSFISFWRGAAIVLSDLASTMFYVGGIAEQAIGKSAPWFVLAVMFFSFAVRSIYMESCSMFVRGGVYVVVRDALGPTMAKLSVSALVVDYILTGPISVVSAGQYLGRLLNEISEMLHQSFRVSPNYFAAVFGVVVTGYFWWSNIKGIHESSGKALRIMQITTVMVVVLLIWCSAYRVAPRKYPLATVALAAKPEPFRAHARLVAWDVLEPDSAGGDDRGVRAFPAGNERLRDSGAGLSRDRLSEAEESEDHGEHRLFLCASKHRVGHDVRGHDHSGRRSAAVLRQPDRRTLDEPGRPGPAEAHLPRLRGDRRRADPFRRCQYVYHRRQRRAEPRGRRRRSARVVSQARINGSVPPTGSST